MDADGTYQGWTNWETWNVALTMDNDERLYNHAHTMGKRCAEFWMGKGRGVAGKPFDWNRVEIAFKRVAAPAVREIRKYEDGERFAVKKINWREIGIHYMADYCDVSKTDTA